MGETMRKLFITFFTAVFMMFALSSTAYAAKQPVIHVALNNEILLCPQDAQPYIDTKGNVFIPLFVAGEKLGASVEWGKNSNSLSVKYGSDTIKITWPKSGKSGIVKLNNKAVKTAISPVKKNKSVYVPLEFFSTLLHCQTTWDNRVYTAFVTSAKNSKNSEAPAEATVTTSEILKIKSFDGYTLTGKLDLPVNATEVSTLVIFVPGTGPNTYDNHRLVGDKEFNYYDLFARELGKRQVGFFRYNTRGVEMGTQPPMYDTIDKKEYRKYTPENQAKDIEIMITELKKNEALKNAKVVLLGWSEGTIIAPLVAERKNVEISSLMLSGYCNEKMQDIIEWQLSGDSTMIFYCRYFDTNFDGVISKKEYLSDPYGIVNSVLGNAKFEQLDANTDKKLTSADFAVFLADQKNKVLDAISKGDDEWLWNNYFQITSEWLSGHAELEANKDRLLKLTMPVNIFHGVYDQNVPLQGVYDIYEACRRKNKTNIKAFVFDQHDHDLNYIQYPLNNIISEGLARIFDECAKVK
jgi:pimeloyl-ACP methyl ester carboxylesterase